MIRKSTLFAMWRCAMIIPSLPRSLHPVCSFPAQTYLTSVPNHLLVLLLLHPQRPRRNSLTHFNNLCSLSNRQRFSSECCKATRCLFTSHLSKPDSQPFLQINPISISGQLLY